MLVSWNWLKDYVPLNMELSDLEARLAMAGLNHEETRQMSDDIMIDLEVTSNRPDWLGHIGIAREIAVLWQQQLSVPQPEFATSGKPADQSVRVTIENPELCPRYIARVIRGVKVGASPDWLVNRLRTIGIASVNNVVDVTNYVLMECGQPLHAFDMSHLQGSEIRVRSARQGEKFEAINHHTYELDAGMCVIADAKRAVALGGVMGGADSEISDRTTDVLIEAADFMPLSIRTTARRLNLHSPSSYRFERGVDPEGIDWASRRCCELIAELAGGTVAPGAVDARGLQRSVAPPIVLRLSQLRRVLGIDVPVEEVTRILQALGNKELGRDATSIRWQAPSWRRDLSREIDLIEEVARVYGYEKIPEDARVPMVPSHRADRDRVIGKLREGMTALGFDEAMTASVVSSAWSDAFSPWTDAPALRSSLPMLRGADSLRRSLLPSLLGARQYNEAQSNAVVELFETAKVYLPRTGELPEEPWMLALTSGRSFFEVKGVLETLLRRLNPRAAWDTGDFDGGFLDRSESCWFGYQGKKVGLLGRVSAATAANFGLRTAPVVAEVRLEIFEQVACLIPQYVAQNMFPTIERDLNLVVDEGLRWVDLAAKVRDVAGEFLESLQYRETYRDPKNKDGAGKKRLMFSMTFRHAERTLTSDEVDAACNAVIVGCDKAFGARLL